MTTTHAQPLRQVRLSFRSADELAHADQPVRGDLSALVVSGSTLWVANDELATVERLRAQDGGGYGEHQSFRLGDYFDLPGGPDDEMDIEGLEIDGGYLWVLGSHSLTREKPKTGSKDHAEALRRLTEVEHHPNRHFLGRVPLLARDGTFTLERSGCGDDARLQPACLSMGPKRGKLGKWLRKDEHIGRFIEVPAKENGFDLEGIAVRGSRALVGLRGPVLRGWAVILELEIEETRPGRLQPRRIGPHGERYRKHFLDLEGLGIRDLCFDQDRLLILAGPTMDLDGPVRVFAWPGCLAAGRQMIITADELEALLDLPFQRGADMPKASPYSGAPTAAPNCWWCTTRRHRTACTTTAPASTPTCSSSSCPPAPLASGYFRIATPRTPVVRSRVARQTSPPSANPPGKPTDRGGT
jgi:Protein of unknown function (DUF3616)